MFAKDEAEVARRSRSAACGITVAVFACLMVGGCSAAATSGAQFQTPRAAVTGTSASGVALKNAPGMSGFASPSEIAPHSALSGPPADPFAGTPANGWGDGVAGIVLPAARPVGGYTAAQVAFALKTTRKLLAAAELNRRTLLGGPPTVLADMLPGSERSWFLANLNHTGVDKQGVELSTRTLVASFPPGDAQLIGSVIKVHGTMHAHAGTDKGGREVLDVSADYLFVYPVQPPQRPAAWMRIVAEMNWTVSFGDWPGGSTSFGPWITAWGTGVAGVHCGTADGYLHPDYPAPSSAVTQPSDSPSGTPIDPYTLGHAGTGVCQATTGT